MHGSGATLGRRGLARRLGSFYGDALYTTIQPYLTLLFSHPSPYHFAGRKCSYGRAEARPQAFNVRSDRMPFGAGAGRYFIVVARQA